jgi:hypothetical protein
MSAYKRLGAGDGQEDGAERMTSTGRVLDEEADGLERIEGVQDDRGLVGVAR